MKRAMAALMLCALMAGGLFAARAEQYPEKNIIGVIQWGAGGGTDSLMRPLATLAEKELRAPIVMRNMTGGTGSIATQYVYDKASDGYTLLMSAENPTLYQALNISALTYEDFACVLLIGDETVGVAVRRDSEYDTFTELILDALARPGRITLATTGTGGLPWEVGAFITHVTGATFNQIPYDSDLSARTAVMGGECDFTVCKVQSGLEAYRSGDLQYLTMFSDAPVSVMPDVTPITVEYPAFKQYLPWGPFYGVFVKKGTDPVIIGALADAFSAGFADEGYQAVLSGYHVNSLGYVGEDAERYITAWRDKTIEALRSSGAIP